MNPINTGLPLSTKLEPPNLSTDPSSTSNRRELRVTVNLGRCCIWTSFTILTLFFCAFAGLLAYPSLQKGHHYQGYLADAESSGDKGVDHLVKPLINHSTKFDIAATVFIRDEQEKAQRHENQRFEETPLFSDVVFHGRQYGDEEQTAVVNLSIPLSVLQQQTLSNYDIRASFVLIPTAPSPLERIKKHTSWATQWATDHKASPRRSWPFPLSEQHNSDDDSPSQLDLAVDRMSVTLPLLHFYGISGSCEGKSSSRSRSSDEVTQWNLDQRKGRLLSTEDYEALDAHPYFTTKTHLRVIEDTEHYRKDKFIKAQSLLRHQCKPSANSDTSAEYQYCDRPFKPTGVFETLFELDAVDSTGNSSEWAYGPFLTTVQSAAGPKDLVPLPVQRGSCRPDLGEKLPDNASPKSIDVQWKISFLPVSPHNQVGVEMLYDLLGGLGPFNHTHGDWTQARKQDQVDLFNGLTGHSHAEDKHVRLRLALVVIRVLIWFTELFVFLDYWYTRRSAYGISASATLCVAADVTAQIVTLNWDGALDYVFAILTVACAGLILSKVIRLQASKRSGKLLLSLTSLQSTHRERFSQRQDLNWKVHAMIYAALVFLYHIFRPDIIIFAPSAFTKPANEIPITTSVLYGWVAVLVAPAHIYSMVSQGILNQRLRVFAGQHKLDLLLNAALFFLSYAEYMEGALGETHGKGDKVTLEGILTSVLMLVRLYQMWVLPSVDQNADDEENE